MNSYLTVHYVNKKPVFASWPTLELAQVHLDQLALERPLTFGDTQAIVKANTNQIVYFNRVTHLSGWAGTLHNLLRSAGEFASRKWGYWVNLQGA